MRAEDVARQFNDCINSGDLDGLAALMTEDHTFTDTLGVSVSGKAACVEAWRGFFREFPDYRNTFADVRARDELVIAVGYSTCSVEVLDGPAIWTATIRDDKVAYWRVYKDTPSVRADLDI